MSDLWTMIWKEWKDVLFQGGGWRAWIRPLLMLGIAGVYVPLQSGRLWLSLTPLSLFVLLWIPFYLIINLIGDAIAGERERHTLETLLASRMPDRAILLGKVLIVVGYGMGLLLASLLLGLVLVNLTNSEGAWQFYPSDLLLGVIVLGLAVTLLGAGGGVLVSLRSSTVRQAQQVLGIGTLVVTFGVGFALSKLLPGDFFVTYTVAQLLLFATLLFALIDVVVLGYAVVRFQRARLIAS
ncbi:MAG TPA: ABC transporter permease [Ktedonobacterales bacterium]|jgi:ABC-2 type transport system permease protein